MQFLKKRNRHLDHDSDFTKSFILQNSYLEAAQRYCADFGKELIVHEQSLTTPAEAAANVAEKIKQLLWFNLRQFSIITYETILGYFSIFDAEPVLQPSDLSTNDLKCILEVKNRLL